ncbi:kinase-like protein [Durotheca rogersii]|uniref:kinase-like protein n=1 Tax=Durotheca rogersii TaxID=419775 RepID=UPI00221FF60D|nr:kinase-like protein [Durotheca rogersii]KAI5863154.1 kinase-like protein [Durotheca rogersii]
MASKSRWADTEEDTALEAKLRLEKEEKKRLKAEKARKAEEEQRARAATEAAKQRATYEQQNRDLDDPNDIPPAKRRKLTPELSQGREATGIPKQVILRNGSDDDSTEGGAKLLRFESGGWSKSRSVENYEKLNDIEEGAYGLVSRARESKTGKVVALKRLKLDSIDRNGFPETALREIQILKDCSHRNIVNLHEVVVSESSDDDNNYNSKNAPTRHHPRRRPGLKNVFLVLEFLEHDLMSVLGDMPEPFLISEIKALLHQLASGVGYLHDHWILHRDLKTSNLLLNNRGQLKIADFGMARYVGDPPPHLTQLVVTLWYRAPELLLGAREYGSAVDMWSVGCIFAELITREPLLQGKNEVDELSRIFELCGLPTEDTWPGFRRLPNARSLRLPKTTAANTGSVVRARFPTLTNAGAALLAALLSLDPDRRPSARQVLDHEFFRQDPKPKHEDMFPTFPSKAGQERRRRRSTPNAPGRGQQAVDLGPVDLSGIFAAREREERGAGFSLRMV